MINSSINTEKSTEDIFCNGHLFYPSWVCRPVLLILNLFLGMFKGSVPMVHVNSLNQIRPSVEHGQQPGYPINVNKAIDSLNVYEN